MSEEMSPYGSLLFGFGVNMSRQVAKSAGVEPDQDVRSVEEAKRDALDQTTDDPMERAYIDARDFDPKADCNG
jgi:ribosomal protein S13